MKNSICPVCHSPIGDDGVPLDCQGECEIVTGDFRIPASKELDFNSDEYIQPRDYFDEDDAYWEETYGEDENIDD